MCGASDQQNQTYQAQAAFMQTLTQAYQQQFAGQNAILSELTKTFEPILQAGPSQEGFSAGEKAALNTQATEGVAQNYQSLQKSLANQQAAQGGGNDFIPSGQSAAIQAELGTSAARQLSGEENAIELANYQTGRQTFSQAAGALGGVAGQMNPLGYAGATTGAGEAAGTTANQIAQANNAWMSALGGAIGGIGSAAFRAIPFG